MDEAWRYKIDVSLTVYEGAEMWELIGLLLLSLLSKKYDLNNTRLQTYLMVELNISGPEAKRTENHFQKLSKWNGLDITVQLNLNLASCLYVF